MANECVELTDIFLKIMTENKLLRQQLAEAQSCKAEVIEYAKLLLEHHHKIDKGLGSNIAAQMESADALYIPQPKCMEK